MVGSGEIFNSTIIDSVLLVAGVEEKSRFLGKVLMPIILVS
jgi:hypothetical protein